MHLAFARGYTEYQKKNMRPALWFGVFGVLIKKLVAPSQEEPPGPTNYLVLTASSLILFEAGQSKLKATVGPELARFEKGELDRFELRKQRPGIRDLDIVGTDGQIWARECTVTTNKVLLRIADAFGARVVEN